MNKVLISSIILFFVSCTYLEVSYPSKSFYVKVKSVNTLDVIAGDAKTVEFNKNSTVYLVEFDSVIGGKTKLFKWVIKETSHGYKVDRLILLNHGCDIISKYSVNDLESIDKDTIDIN